MKFTVDEETVRRLAHSSEVEQRLELGLMGDAPENYTAEILEALVRTANRSASLLATFCRSRFAFFGDPFAESGCMEDSCFQTGQGIRNREQAFLRGVRNWLSTKSPEERDSCFRLLADQKALRNEYKRIMDQIWGEAAAEAFLDVARSSFVEPERQLGFAPTFRCNLACPYCMSAGLPRVEADREGCRRLIRWAVRAGVKKLRLSGGGGEPTFYPGFETLLREARDFGLRLYLPSNLLASDDAVRVMNSVRVDCVFAHVRSPHESEEQYRRFVKNAIALREAGIAIVLRYNIVGEDWSYLIGLARQLGNAAVALAPPVEYGASSRWDEERWVGGIQESHRIACRLKAEGVTVVLSRPLPLCLVETVQPNAWDFLRGTCMAHAEHYLYNVSLRPDFTVGLCDGDHCEQRPRIWQFETWEALREYVAPRMRAWLSHPLWDRCKSCYYRERALCQGACLVAKIADPSCALELFPDHASSPSTV